MEGNYFSIPIQRLKNKSYSFDFTIGNELFQHFGAELSIGKVLHVRVEVDKSETMIIASFQIEGFVVLECDRSLRTFEEPIRTEKRLLFKYGENWDESDDEIVIIPFGHSDLDISQYLYDFVMLALPIKKIHPELREETLDGVYFTTETEQEEEAPDPRWEKLKNLKFKKD